MAEIDLNSDLGESLGAWRMGDDAAMLAVVSSANVACGFHAGDPAGILTTLKAAAANGVTVGAHVSYPDLTGFGRRNMDVASADLIADVIYQIGALKGLAAAAGTDVRYVKPHGALYNDLVRDDALFTAVLQACASYRAGLPLMVLALADNGRERRLAQAAGVPLLFEAFADRAYLADGQLAPRRLAGAVHQDGARILAQALAIARGQPFADIDGKPLQLRADSLCVHGDNAESLAVLRRLRAQLDAA